MKPGILRVNKNVIAAGTGVSDMGDLHDVLQQFVQQQAVDPVEIQRLRLLLDGRRQAIKASGS
jgi:hypothetical protein